MEVGINPIRPGHRNGFRFSCLRRVQLRAIRKRANRRRERWAMLNSLSHGKLAAGAGLAILLAGAGKAHGESFYASTNDLSPVDFSHFITVDSRLRLEPKTNVVWKAGTGDGFAVGTREAGLPLGAGVGTRVITDARTQNLALSQIHYGLMLGDVQGGDRWYRGNWELLGEIFGGKQFNPQMTYVAGVAPTIRYNFATGSRFIPFLDLGGGISATDIRGPGLSAEYEFNAQTGAGFHYFWRDRWAFTFQYRFFHLTDAGIFQSRAGVNTSLLYWGISRFF